MTLVDSKGLFTTVDAATLAQVPAQFAPTDKGWVGFAARSTVFAYNGAQATSSTFQTRRPGNVVRSTSQAIPVPITNVSPTQPATSKPVFLRSSATRGRQVRATASSHPIVRT
jgi:hypothetical protein